MQAFSPLTEDLIMQSGVFPDRKEYIRRLREVMFHHAALVLADAVSGRDAELLQMVRTLDQMDEAINLLSERVIEWYLVTNPSFSQKGRKGSIKRVLPRIRRTRSRPLRGMADQLEGLAAARTALAADVSRLAGRVIPNTSELVGGLVAARIMARAGGLRKLASMPGSSVQVIGAEAALFSHIRIGSPSPKHGIIFQHRRVHNAQKGVRGRVARLLAAKIAIAARIDFFRGEPDEAFLRDANGRIDLAAGGSHDQN
ncbi:MAG: RNA-processing protein [Methanocalculus sp. MSAO_Arc1]|nr:MAG: RNA-processing protein [Methanocalculus sp. MSAO_Arc1]